MVAINPRQRHAAGFERIGRRFASRRVISVRAATDVDGDDSTSSGKYSIDDNFTVRRGQMGPADAGQEEFAIEKIWSKRRINTAVLYLLQWEGYAELQWDFQGGISWQALAEFEREYVGSVWDLQTTRGRRRTLKRERPTRTSRRIQGMVSNTK